MTRSFPSLLLPAVLFMVFFVGLSLVQFTVPDLPDNDGFYHIKLAWIMRNEGLKPSFHWLPLSILNPDDFYDHHFLFHASLIPFTFGDLRLGAKWAAVIFASLSLMTVWYLLDRQRVPLAWLWALGLLGVSGAFLYRISITRAQSLSLAFLMIGLTLILAGNYRKLGILAFLFVWTYDGFPLLLVLAIIHLMAVALIEHRFEIRPVLWIGAGMVLGMILNPYFPDNILFTYRHLLPKLTDATSIRVGNEWYPYDTGQLLENSLPALVAFACGALALGLTAAKMEVRTATSFLLAIVFGLMLFQARRFVEYFPAFTLIFAAFAWAPLLKPSDDQIEGTGIRPMERGSKGYRFLLPTVVLTLVVAASLLQSIPVAQERMHASKPYDLYQAASAWLEENSAAGERVFQTDWDDFPRLFFYNSHNTYLVGLDPTYLQMYDEDLYELWVDITRGRVKHPSSFIAGRFSARYVHSDLDHEDFLQRAAQDPGLREVYRDDQAVIFEVIRE